MTKVRGQKPIEPGKEPGKLREYEPKGPAVREDKPAQAGPGYEEAGKKPGKPPGEAVSHAARKFAEVADSSKGPVERGLSEKDEGVLRAYFESGMPEFRILGGARDETKFTVGRNEYDAVASFDTRDSALKALGDVGHLRMEGEGRFGIVKYSFVDKLGARELYLMLSPNQMASLKAQDWQLPVGLEIVKAPEE